MMNKLLGLLAVLILFESANAQAEVSLCKHMAGTLEDLTLLNCVIQDDVLVAKYHEAAPALPFATEFDERNVFVALSSDSGALYKRIGVREKNRKISLTSTLLAMPPEQDQILIRRVVKEKVRHRGWIVFFEEIQYPGPGGAPGYPMKCGTAIRSQRSKNESIAASECFGYQNEERFLNTLEKIEMP